MPLKYPLTKYIRNQAEAYCPGADAYGDDEKQKADPILYQLRFEINTAFAEGLDSVLITLMQREEEIEHTENTNEWYAGIASLLDIKEEKISVVPNGISKHFVQKMKPDSPPAKPDSYHKSFIEIMRK